MKTARFLCSLLFAIAGLAACVDDDVHNSPVTPPFDCEGTEARWQRVVDGLDDSCTTSADCTEAGGQAEPDCDCSPLLGDGATAVQRAAYLASDGPQLADAYFASCQIEERCDRAPPDIVCLDSGRCGAVEQSCFDTWPDAGAPDAVDAPDA
jgi:hypothetical protein